jgi:hypothetical protein
VVVVLVAVVLGVAKKRLPKQLPIGKYRVGKPLSSPEQVLYWRLKEAMPECVVLGQVSFSRFMQPDASSQSVRRGLFNAISQKTTDFLVCLPDFTVVAAVELDDRSHVAEKDVRRDAIFESAGIPIVRVRADDIPSSDELRAVFIR